MKALIIGLGSIARKHISALRSLVPDIEIYALRSGHSIQGFEGVTDLFEPFDIKDNFDFAVISNPTSCHAETLKRLADTTFPLFIEKPVVDSVAHRGLIDRLSASGRLTYVACNLRFLECIEFVRNYILDNPEARINEVNVYCGSYLPDWRPGTDYHRSYSAIPELGGGVNIDLIHEIDYVCHIFGPPAKSRGLCSSRSSLGIRAVDYANYVLIYPGFIASIVLDYFRRDYKRTLEILFEDSTWTVDLAENKITDHQGKTIFESRGRIADTYLTQMKYFLKTVNEGTRPENDAKEAFEVLKICLNYERLDQ